MLTKAAFIQTNYSKNCDIVKYHNFYIFSVTRAFRNHSNMLI